MLPSPVSRLQQHEGQVQDLHSQLQHMRREQQHLQMQLQAAAAAAKAAAEAQEVRHHALVLGCSVSEPSAACAWPGQQAPLLLCCRQLGASSRCSSRPLLRQPCSNPT